MIPADYQYIENSDALATAVEHMLAVNAVAVDLEADSMFHFRERICLIQMATDERIFIIDPLNIADPEPLRDLLATADIQKIFHGSDYDIRSLYRDFRFEVDGLFDTELASRFLGIKQTGLNTILEARFGVQLDKRYQKKDWSQRPLPEKMIAYAANDVAYLLPLAQMLQDELSAKGRLYWVAEELEHLQRVRPAEDNGDPLFIRFKGAGRLKPRQLAILEAILQLRRRIASRKDRPPFKVFGNQSITRMVETTPTNEKALRRSGAMSPKQVHMYAGKLITAINGALALAPDKLPRYPRQNRRPRNAAHPQRVKRFKDWREKRAQTLGLEPGLIINNALLTTIAEANPKSLRALSQIDGIRSWQVNTFGGEIMETLLNEEGS